MPSLGGENVADHDMHANAPFSLAVCWRPMVQSLVVLFTTELKYMAVAEAAKEAL